MKKNGRSLIITITAVSIAMVGLVVMQVHLLKESYEQKEQAFDRTVQNAVTAVAQQLEKEEAASRIFTVAMQEPDGKMLRMKKLHTAGTTTSVRRSPAKKGSFSWVIAESSMTPQGKQMRVEVFHSSGVDTVPSIIIRNKGKMEKNAQMFSYSFSTNDGQMRMTSSIGDSAVSIFSDTTRKRRGEIVSKVVDKLLLVERLPIEERVSMPQVDSLLHASLAAVGITMPYRIRITVGEHDSVRLGDDSTAFQMGDRAPYRARLFPNDILSPRYELAVALVDRSSYVLSEMSAVLAMSVLFILILIISFVSTVRLLVQQRRFAGSVVDFINNMTHEFKTPIATIALAAEAIAKPEVLKSRVKLRRYNSVIADENNRMKHQVDTILQLAVLERGEFDLKRSSVDLHAVITHAAVNAALQAEQRSGSVTTALEAAVPVVFGDPVHLANIIHNLLDNALKYSPAVPTIHITTAGTSAGIRITVQDNGIGIAEKDLPRVFDKYYRVPTGNTHDVKGFGLGLSYVKLIVNAHHGSVSINSTVGKGTTVTVELPR